MDCDDDDDDDDIYHIRGSVAVDNNVSPFDLPREDNQAWEVNLASQHVVVLSNLTRLFISKSHP